MTELTGPKKKHITAATYDQAAKDALPEGIHRLRDKHVRESLTEMDNATEQAQREEVERALTDHPIEED